MPIETHECLPGSHLIHSPSGLEVVVMQKHALSALCKFPRGAELSVSYSKLELKPAAAEPSSCP